MTPPEHAPRTDLAVVIVTWNNAQIIADTLRSLLDDLAGSGLRYEIWLVDSASDDHTVDVVRREFDNVILLENETNKGFGVANNQAIRQLGFDGASRRGETKSCLFAQSGHGDPPRRD